MAKKKKVSYITSKEHNLQKLGVVYSLEENEKIKKEKLSNYLQKKKKQKEETEKAKSSMRTDSWRDLSVSYQNSTGNNFGSYRDKQVIDSNGGLSGNGKKALEEENEKEYKRKLNKWSQEQTDSWKNQSVNYQNANGNNFGAYREKQIVDSAGGWSGNAKQALLTENAKDEKRQQEANKQRLDRWSQNQTNAWKDRSTSYNNSTGSNYGAYREKQIIDSNGGWSGNGKQALKTENEKDNERLLEAYEKAVANWENNNTEVTRIGPYATTEEMLKNYARQQRDKYSATASLIYGDYDAGKWTGGRTEDVKGLLAAGNQGGYRTQMDQAISLGLFDETGDVRVMSRSAREQKRTEYSQLVDELKKSINAYEEINRGDAKREQYLVELLETPEIRNEKTIINGDGYTDEEKENAEFELDYLLNTGEVNGENVYDVAQRFVSEVIDGEEEYDEQTLRQMAYDTINGDGAYASATKDMTPEQKAALDQEIDDALRYATEGNPEKSQTQKEKMLLEYYEDQIKAIDYENQREDSYKDLMGNYQELGDTEWHRENVPRFAEIPETPNVTVGITTAKVDVIYAYLGGLRYGEEQDTMTLPYRSALMMNQAERDIFISLYNDNKKSEALAFYEGLEPTLNQFYSYIEAVWDKDFSRRYPITASIASVVATAAQSVEAIGNLPGQLSAWITGNQNAQTDPFSSAYGATRFKNATRNNVAADLGDEWGQKYLGVMSGADSALNVALAKGLGFTTPTSIANVSLALFHTQAFETSLQNNMANGSDNFGYNMMEAWIDAAIETTTEIVSVGAFLKNPKNILTFLAHMVIEEPSEEIAGAIVEPIVKEMVGHKNKWDTLANEILAKGEYTDKDGNTIEVNDADTATRIAMKEWVHEIFQSAEQALYSIGPSAVYQGARMYTQTRNTGANIQRGNEEGGANAARDLATAAIDLDPDTYSYKLGNRLLQKIEGGKNISNYEVGRLTQTMMTEAGESSAAKATEILKNRISLELKEREQQAPEGRKLKQDKATDLLTDAITRGIENLPKRQQDQIQNNENLLSIYKEFTENEETVRSVAEEQANATKTERNAMATVSDSMTRSTVHRAMDRTISQYEATEEEKNEATGERVEGARGIIFHDNDGNSTNARLLSFSNGTARIEITRNGEKVTETVNTSELAKNVSANNKGTAAILWAKSTNNKLYSDVYTNTMLAVMDQDTRLQNMPGTFMQDATMIMQAGYTMREMPTTSMPQEVAQFLYQTASAEMTTLRAQETEGAETRTHKPGEGRAVYDNVEFGTKAWNEKIQSLNISEAEKKKMNFWAAVSKMAGIDVRFTNNAELQAAGREEADKLYGAATNSGITINIEGRNYALNEETGKAENTGETHDIGITFGHETMHYLQYNTRNGFDNLQKYVMDRYAETYGEGALFSRLQRILETNKDTKNYADAISEFMADSLDTMMTNEDVIRHIYDTNKSLYKDLKRAVRSLVTKLKTAIGGMLTSQSRDSQTFELVTKDMKKLAELFNLAWDEMASGKLNYSEEELQKAQEIYDQARQGWVNDNFDYSNLTEEQQRLVAERLSQADAVLAQHGLIATHSTTFDKMRKMMKMDGIPAPSVAISQTNGSMSSGYFGEMSFVFSRDSLDPQMNENNYIFGRDAWTPTFPKVNQGLFGDTFADNGKEVTAQNAVELMRDAQDLKSGVYGNGFMDTTTPDITNNFQLLHHIASEFSKNYQNIEEVQADRGRLGTADRSMIMSEMATYEGEIDSLKQDVIQEVEAAGRDIGSIYGDRQQGEALELLTAFRIALYGTDEQRQEYGLTDDTIQRIWDLVEGVQQLDVSYAEAKPMRVMDWNEIRVVVTPIGTPQDILDFLTDKGIHIEKYNGLADRVNALEYSPEVRGLRFSQSQLDTEYEQAVKNNDTNKMQAMIDEKMEQAFSRSKVRGKDGKLLKMFHGTPAEFNEFRRDKIGSTGRFEGSGFNFTPYEGRASSYGKNVLAGYLDIENPLSAEKKTISVARLAQIIRQADPTGDNIISNYAQETRDYGSASFVQREARTAARQIWEYSENDVDIYSEISSADPDAEGLIEAFEKLGYDGLIHYDEDGNIKTAVAFSSEQFKRSDPVIYDENNKLIKLSERGNKTKPDIRYSLATVEPVKSSNNDIWTPGHTEAWFRENGFPIYQDVPIAQQNINRDTSKKGHGTQIPSTESTYRKLFNRIKEQNPDTWKSMRVLDASSGLGLGTIAGREMGFDVTDIEPFPNDNYKPNYTDYIELERQVNSGETEAFDFIISNAVLNVIPQDTRDNLVAAMGNLLKPGGSMFINVISKDYSGAIQSNPNIQESLKNRKGSARTMEGDYTQRGNAAGRGHETFVWGSNSVQKVFSTPELIGYLKDALGEGYTIKRDNIGMTGVLVTKNGNTMSRLSQAQLDDQYMAAVKSENESAMWKLMYQAAQQAGYTDTAFHGTDRFGFTEWDMEQSQGEIFVAYNWRTAKTYSKDGKIRRITEGNVKGIDYDSLNSRELEDLAMDTIMDDGNGNTLWNVEYNEKESEDYGFEIYDLVWDVDDEYGANTSIYQTVSRKSLVDMIKARNPKQEVSGIYELYTKPGKQLVVDAKGANWNRIKWENVIISDPKAEEYLNSNAAVRTRIISKWAKENGYDSVRINNVYDHGGRNMQESGHGDIGIFFNQKNVKSADPITYDNNGEVIKPSERFNDDKTDIRWSRALTAEEQADVDQAEEQGISLDVTNHTASRFSHASYMRSEYYKNPEKMARMLARNVLGSESKANIAKAQKWIRDVTSISSIIGDNKAILDYIASPGRSSFKSNPEYGGSIDSSTICAKRRLQTGTIDAIQSEMPEFVMTAEDFLRIRNMMKERGYEVSCGLCFVESSRKNIAKYANQFMNEWNSQHPDNKVTMPQINTVLGLENTRLNNKDVYEAYEKFMNKLAQRKPKLFEMRSEYDNDILKHFRNDSSVTEKNKRGGMRINSFSDFEIVHLIDMMQVIMDMSNVGLAGQAYTKVKEFAEALGPTGLKINMSMIAKGVDENGRIIFDEVEGMKWDDVKDLRDKYADNVGTVCVIFTEDQLMAAMNDDRIDYIIPFHRSQWNKTNYKDIGLPDNVKDFTYWQNERYAKPVFGKKKDGTQKKLRATNYMPNEYWDFSKSGKENAEAYLQKCFEENKIPKFWKWLQKNGDGSYSLKEDGSTDGYWKLLIDFKMYNHITDKGAEQMPVKPEFDMDASKRMLREYKGGHAEFPVAKDVVEDFVKEKRNGRKGIARGTNGRITLAGNELEGARLSQWDEDSMEVQNWIMNQSPSSLQTEDEFEMVKAFKGLRVSMSLSMKKISDYEAKIKQLESRGNLTAEERDELTATRNRMEIEQTRLARKEDEMIQITSSEGYAGMMYRQNMILKDFIAGKTQDQVRQTVEEMLQQVKETQAQIKKDTEDLKKLAEEQAVKTMQGRVNKSSAGRMATMLRKNYNSAMSKSEIESRMAEMALKQADGQDITSDCEALARDLVDKARGIRTEVLDYLKGITLHISQNLADEMKAENYTLKELREQLKGSGVTLKVMDRANLREQWTELWDQNKALPDPKNYLSESDLLHKILGTIQDNVEKSKGTSQNEFDMDEVALVVKAMTGNITTYLTDDPEARAQIESLTKQIEELSKRAEKTAKNMRDLEQKLDDVILAGQKAKGWTTVLQRDVNEAIKYYNKMAEVAANEEKTKVRQSIIENLRSENTAKLIRQQRVFEEKMKNDQKARELAQDNLALRRKITTVIKRAANLLTKETDLKNIPEQAKPLARQMIRMVANHDMVHRMVTFGGRTGLSSIIKTLDILDARDGEFTDESLNWLIRGEGENADWDIHDRVVNDLINIETGLMEYANAEGRGNITLQDRKAALDKVQKAVSEIWNVIRATQMAEINGRKVYVNELALSTLDDMAHSRFKGEWTGWFGRKIGKGKSLVVYGNLTPEYFIKNLKNGTISQMYNEYHIAENRAGLLYGEAQERIAQIAEETGYNTWDQEKKYVLRLERGGSVSLNLEQMMQLYATWKREETLQAEIGSTEKTFHLSVGGFYVENDEQHKVAGRELFRQRSYKMTEIDFGQLSQALTDEQKQYVDRIVEFMSKDMSELGNEASMKMYGIKKYNEQYYFPFEIWSGVKAVKSDAGAGGSMESHRGAHPSFSNRLRNNASNALMIRGFTQQAAKHIVQMVNYNTFAPAIETLQRVMNSQTQQGEEDNITNRNLWAAFGETYGKDALDYLQDFQKSINGGVNRSDSSFYDKLLSRFRKSAVAGSMSVALQQPLSYIRASIVISPKYLTAAWSPTSMVETRKLVQEMRKYSGVAVLKQMGKFDMGIGRSAQQFITPQAKESTARTAYNWISDKTTALPELMDTFTWARIWAAVKAETKAQNSGMDTSSDEFMQKVTDRFNEVLRLTQVYDSVLVRSRNMRSTNPVNKMLTSFMAEPTLTANVLADAVVNAKEKGGKAHLAKAAATFLLSAVAQSLVKGLMGAGRNPDKKKTWDENMAYRFMYSFLTEINPLGLIPGYSDMITLIKNGEISDDALSVIGKIFAAGRAGLDLATGKQDDIYRGIEDSVGVITQLYTNIPMKNIARDVRAMYNFFTQPYAKRETSEGVLTYQFTDQFFTADTMLGALNEFTGKAIYDTSNGAYYKRIVEAEKNGNKDEAEKMRAYLTLGKGVSDQAMATGTTTAIKEDESSTYSERVKMLQENGTKDSSITSWILNEFKDDKISKEEAEELYMQINPDKTEDDAYFKISQAKWETETGENVTDTDWFRVDNALKNGSAAEIKDAVEELKQHGYEENQISDHMAGKITERYKSGDADRTETESLLKTYTDKTEDDVWWALDRIDYSKETGKDAGGGKYYRLYDAIDNNKSDEIKAAVNTMVKHGMEMSNIKKQIATKYKQQYLEASGSEKTKLMDALTKAYKAVGLTAAEAVDTINGWKKKEKKN